MCLAQLERFLQEIGVVPAKVPPKPPQPQPKGNGTWYRDREVPF